ncbi:MAG: glycerate kinase [Peptococcaceae bacterium BICA1-8]|nr:MAG: glycerate kinase [Peptococcaceae bacterium BICA1-8]
MKKIIIAPDSFKGSMSAKEVADAIERGIKGVLSDVEIVKIPMADGGEGTVETLVDATMGKIVTINVLDPLGNDAEAYFGILGDGRTAVIEMALASGLTMVPSSKRNPLITTTYGTGQLIKAALDHGCQEFIIGIGGSATNDGGVGMAQALGVSFLDQEGQEIGFGGGSLSAIKEIKIKELDPRLNKCIFKVACDVDNPLCGLKGASHIFGPQKGADSYMIKILDENLAHLAEIIKRDIGVDVKNEPGAGAAGGLGAGLMAFCNASLQRGIELVIEATKLEEKVIGADLVITGEGQIDFQTVHGKTPYGVAQIAKKYKIPVVALVGTIGTGVEVLYMEGINAIFSIVEGPMTLEECMKNGSELAERTAGNVVRALNMANF